MHLFLEVRSPTFFLLFFGQKLVFCGTYYQISSVSNEKSIKSFCMYRKLSITRFFWHLAIFGKLFCCLLIDIFLTQFWTENLIIHKPQPRLQDLVELSATVSFSQSFLIHSVWMKTMSNLTVIKWQEAIMAMDFNKKVYSR